MLRKTLPSFVDEFRDHSARLVLYDCSSGDEAEAVRRLVKEQQAPDTLFLMQSDNVSASVARNTAFSLCKNNFNPWILGFVEDDHVLKRGFLDYAATAVQDLYNKPSSNGLRIGLFSACSQCNGGKRSFENDNKDFVRSADEDPGLLGGVNACCRFSLTQHWDNVLKDWDVDEYLISEYQTNGIGRRNYNKGYCAAILKNGEFMDELFQDGRGTSSSSSLKLWDNGFTASDGRANFIGKDKRAMPHSSKSKVKMRARHFLKKVVR